MARAGGTQRGTAGTQGNRRMSDLNLGLPSGREACFSAEKLVFVARRVRSETAGRDGARGAR